MPAMAREDGTATSARIQGLIHEACLRLNDEDWNGFLDLCDPNRFQYTIGNYSPEIRRDQIWMDRNHTELRQLVALLPKHNSDRSQLTRQVSVYRIERTKAPFTFSAVSLMTIYRTQLDGVNSAVESGQTSLYAVGKYLDQVVMESEMPRLISRAVRLDTRQLDVGSHYLF